MARYVDRVWQPQPGSYEARAGRPAAPYDAYLPDPLALLEPTLRLPGVLAAAVADLERALRDLDRHLTDRPALAGAAAALTRIEAIASSRLEGIVVDSATLAQHEARARAGRRSADPGTDPPWPAGQAGQVLGNVEATEMAVAELATAPQLELAHLTALHRKLMDRSDRPELGGVIRTTQNWLGGFGSTPPTARFVPPPPEAVGPLMADLCAAMNTADLPAVVQAALVHAQFETIHPFGDGNGRTGRALIHTVLARRGLTPAAIAPVSAVLATRRDAYIDGLTAYRYADRPDSAPAHAGIGSWLQIFLAATADAVDDARTLCEDIEALEGRWRARLAPRRASAADRILPRLAATLVLSVRDIETTLGVSRQAAAVAMRQLAEVGVVTQVGDQQRHRWFAATEMVDLIENLASGANRRRW